MTLVSATTRSHLVPLAGGQSLDLSRPIVMGVLNVTPDSFSDGGRWVDPAEASARARQMVEEGARLIDVGGESTRPGAARVAVDEEIDRVIPVIERLVAADLPARISIDTRKAEVARAALAAGASLVNDVSCLSDPALVEVTARAGAALCIGHIQGDPESMQGDPSYTDVVAEVAAALGAARDRAIAGGVDPAAILVDPGIGFGKTLEHNLRLLASLGRLQGLGPVVIGVSRKSMLGALLDGRPTSGRLAGGLGAAVWSVLSGARVVRTHDVRETVDALHVAWSIRQAREEGAG